MRWFYVTAPISSADLSNWRKAFYSEPKNIVAQNACSRVDPLDVCTSRQRLQCTQHVYSHKVILHLDKFLTPPNTVRTHTALQNRRVNLLSD